MTPRHTDVVLKYNHVQVSNDIAKYLLGLTYTDHSSGQADDLQLSLEDTQQIWIKDWVPEKGDVVEAQINLVVNDKTTTLDCGYFEIDELECNDPPAAVTIKAVSAALSSALRGEENTRAWENIKLKDIATELATKAEMSVSYLAEYNPLYKRRDQTDQSDLAFLMDCCEKAGLALKVTNDTLVVFDEEEFEQKDPIATLERGKSNIISARFKTKTRDVYRACVVKYKDPSTGQTFEYIFEPENAPATGQLLKISERVESPEEGKLLARKRLREKNLKENMASMKVVGDPLFVAGTVIAVKGYGKFDGNYYITQATHGCGNSGYTVDLEMHKTMKSYMINLKKSLVIDRPARKHTRAGGKKAKSAKTKRTKELVLSDE